MQNLSDCSVAYTSRRYVSSIFSACIMLFVTTALFGCSSHVIRPMSSSLTSLTSETSTTETKILNYSELLSVAGLLPMPDVGVMYYQPNPQWWKGWFDEELGAFKSVGLARNPVNAKSFRIIGETTNIPTYEDTINAVAAIDKLSEASAEGVSNLIKQSSIRLQLSRFVEEKIKYEDDGYNPDKDYLHSWIDKDLNKDTKLKLIENKIRELRAAELKIDKVVQSDKERIDRLKEIAEKATMKPGLIVAQWTTQSSGGAGASAGNSNESGIDDSDIDGGSAVDISASASKGQSGLAVLGGLKVVSFFVAEDYMRMLASTETEGFRSLLHEVGVTTSAMQTKYISYSSNANIASSINVQAQIEASSLYGISSKSILQGMDTAKLSAYLTNVSNLSNRGNIGGVRWYRDEIDFEMCAKNNSSGQTETVGKCEFHSMGEYRPYGYKAENQSEGTAMKDESEKAETVEAYRPSEYDGWVTIQAVLARLNGSVLSSLLPEYDKEKAAKNAEESKKVEVPKETVALEHILDD